MLPDISDSVRKIHRFLKTTDHKLSLRKHLAAVKEIKTLYASLLAGGGLTQADKTTLLATGLRLHRRGQSSKLVGSDARGLEEREARTSAALLFATICCGIVNASEAEEEPADYSAEEEHVAEWLAQPPVSPHAFREEAAAHAEDENAESKGVDAGEAGRVVVSCLRLGKRLCDRTRQCNGSRHHTLSEEAFEELLHLSHTHFSAATLCVVAKSMVLMQGPEHKGLGTYASLQVAGLEGIRLSDAADERNRRLRSIVTSAESEAGQAILRDLLASFLIPREVLGIRSTLCFDRDTARRASLACPDVVAHAHAVAIAGALEAWNLHAGGDGPARGAALLAGLALITRRVAGSAAAPFAGRVELDFLSANTTCDASLSRLRLVPETDRWVLYSLGTRGMPIVSCQGRGLQGLCTAVLLMQDSLLSGGPKR